MEARKYAQERRELAAEQREREARQRDSDASLARLVIAQLGKFAPSVVDSEDEYDQEIVVHNHSDSFVFDVVVRIPGTQERKLIHFIKPATSEKVEFRGLSDMYHVLYIGCGGPASPYELRITVEFTDPSGRRWRREGWDPPLQLPNELANPSLYRYLLPTSHSDHPYDAALQRLGLAIDDVDTDPTE